MYPNIARWVADGWVEIGYDYNTESFVRAFDEGGEVFTGKRKYTSLDEALADLEEGIKQWFGENN